MRTFTYDTTYEQYRGDDVVGSMEVRIVYHVTFGEPAQISGPPERCHDGWADELEIINVHVETLTMSREYRWFDASPEEFQAVKDWAEMTCPEELINHARNCEADAEEAAREHAAETRAELARMEQ